MTANRSTAGMPFHQIDQQRCLRIGFARGGGVEPPSMTTQWK